ncbi:murein transglycosylase domain-containing protein [Thiomicrorhabdus heinhorstiae]|uniref:DUF3393 domain-containing protein n=1 Tax=Thiomicrorhabdus heinhorstiae TaxID=2748010 RepID=A0ABS0BZ09_9GAMM|nr:murein transglycosylase domain-containing protein [Thiomicrorhabdus heinhorstiae]MBF6058674.1 DUF3393 domain-containing protein [Thiomicrorhabdus heinhorstiae]
MGSLSLKNVSVISVLLLCAGVFSLSDWLAQSPQILNSISSSRASAMSLPFVSGQTAMVSTDRVQAPPVGYKEQAPELNINASVNLASSPKMTLPSQIEQQKIAVSEAVVINPNPSAPVQKSAIPLNPSREENAQSGKPQAFVKWRQDSAKRGDQQNYLEIGLPNTLATHGNFLRAVSRVLLSNQAPDNVLPLTREPLDLAAEPFLLGWVRDATGQEIRYPAQASAYARHLLESSPPKFGPLGQYQILKVPLDMTELPHRARPYRQWVQRFSDEFSIPQALIYAVMEVESGFNSRAVSRSNALGLMQIKADAAGRDVYQLVDHRSGKPSHGELFNPQANIRMGTAYLSLLQNHYLKQINNLEARELVAIAAYNGGLSSALSLFGVGEDAAIEQLNRLSLRQIYQKLRFYHPAEETRGYIHKVLQAKNRYQRWLGKDQIRV